MVFKPTCGHYGVEGDAHTNLGELGSAARAVVGAVMTVTHCDRNPTDSRMLCSQCALVRPLPYARGLGMPVVVLVG